LTIIFYSSVISENPRKGGSTIYHPRFKGSHYDIGLKFGKILKKKNIDFDTLIDLNKFQKDIRYQTAYNALKNIDYIDGIEHAKAILSGKHGFMCQYDKALHFETIWSSVFDISNGKIYRAEGNPSRTKFKEDIRSNKL
jgi:predicted choloylglycine hydrolase